jgi:LPXTG-motif cell wall-anchored protein
MLLAASALLLGIPAATAYASSATTGTGWIRLAHLSPNTPAVDVYLYSFGNSNAMIVLHHVAYGTVSPYESVQAGDYSVAMRATGAPASSQPVLSTSVTIAAGHAYTVAGMGPESGLRLQVLEDELTTPPGQARVRVIQASLKQQVVHVTFGSTVLASNLKFASVTAYQTVSPGTETVTVSSSGGNATSSVTLVAGTVHTLVVLDGASGLEVVNLEDASGSGTPPAGGVSTGFGGSAPHGPGSPVPWLAAIGAGCLLALTGGLGLRRKRQLSSGI